jgi:hypothetical protein
VTEEAVGPGTLLAGRFALEDLLDESSGALFWRATDQVLARSVAVHVLPDTDPRAIALLGGARSSALVSDPHLLRVLDAAKADGMVYVVNEWGSGVSLDRLLAEGVLSPRRAAWVVAEVAEAIATAHRNGVAHGRLLPENVMISETGTVKLIGFVIDGVLRYPEGQRLATDGTPLTARESDVVNLAGLLYAALVGRWPGTAGSTVPPAPTEHDRPLRPRRVRAGVPRPLDAICEQVLNGQLHPNAAPIDTAVEIKAALSDFLGDPTGSSAWQPSGHEPTAVLDRSALPGSAAADPAPADARDPSDGAEVGVDPEATQAGTPVFVDDDDAVPAGSGRDGRHRPSPPPAFPEHPERPLFADDRASSLRHTGPGTAPGGGSGSSHDAGRTSQAGTPSAGSSRAGSSPEGSSPVSPHPEDEALRNGTVRSAFSGGFSGGSRSSTGDRSSLDAGRTQRSVGAGNGSVPPVWGPDADEAADELPPGQGAAGLEDDLPGRSWLRLAVVLAVVLVVVVGAVLALDLGRGPADEPTGRQSSSTSPSPAAGGGKPVSIAGVRDFDPQGDPPEENPQLAGRAADGKPGTFWTTVTYLRTPELGGLKSGVGLLVDLGTKTSVGDVRLTLGGSPTALQILAAPDATSAPTGTDGLTTVASADDAGTSVNLRLEKPVSTRWLVVRLTKLPPAPGGFQGRVAEISVRS